MPDILSTIRTLGVADSAVQTLIATRWFNGHLPQKAKLPAVTAFVVDDESSEHLGGIIDVVRARIQFSCFATTRTASVSLYHAVRLALVMKHRGDNSGTFINDITVAQGERHLDDRPETGGDASRYVTQFDLFVNYRTTTS